MPATAPASTLPVRHGLGMAWLLIGGYAGASLDLLVAIAYWAPHGVAPSRVAQSIAAWLLGPAAFTGGLSSVLLGILIYGQVIWGTALLYYALARRYPLLLRRPFACGALYGGLAYLVIFHLLVPLLFGRDPVGGALWTVTCLLAYATVVGMPCALSARLAHEAARTP